MLLLAQKDTFYIVLENDAFRHTERDPSAAGEGEGGTRE